ncbi:DUF4179 domain-containing protein [Clostridium sp. LP20]|uniref:DUF4179 domain-containing protein n=1 Tax=Clostridium sp. LP20 TaxID=3418665 RepID=UPI003EE63FFC
MNEDRFDEIIKERLINEYNKVPEEINMSIDNTLSNLKPKKKKTKYLKVVVGLIIAFIGIGGIGATVTAVATGIPVKDVIYERVGLSRGYQEYASDLNISKESNRVKITITSAVFDGYKLRLAYKIESDNRIKEEFNNFINAPYLLEAAIKVNEKEAFLSGSGSGTIVDDYSMAAVVTYDFKGEENFFGRLFGIRKLDVLDTFNFGIQLKQTINGNECEWIFNIPISSSKMKDQIKEYKIDKNIGGGRIDNIIVTPLSIYMDGKFNILNEASIGDESPDYILIDDKGREYSLSSMGSGTLSSGSILGRAIKGGFEKEYDNNYSDVKSIKIIPYELKEGFKGKLKDLREEKIELRLMNEEFIATDSDELKVTNVVRGDNETRIYYETKYQYTSNLYLNEREYEKYRYKEREVLENGEGVYVVEGMLEDGIYELFYQSIEKTLNINEDDTLTINLK